MASTININNDRAQCESCEKFFDHDEIAGCDEDGNQFCEDCVSKIDELQCPECNGEGGYEVGPECGLPASACCGGCYRQEECKNCGGSGIISNPDYIDNP